MSYDVIETTYENIECNDCHKVFTETTTTGPVNICIDCAGIRARAIFQGDV